MMIRNLSINHVAGRAMTVRLGKVRVPMGTWDSPCPETIQTDDDLVWQHCLPAHPQAVPEARRAAIRACSQAGASDDECFALDLALGEALANAVVHGIPTVPDLQTRPSICLRIWCYHGRMIIEVRDQGQGFDPPLPPYRMPSDNGATHGRGLPLMEKLTDALLVSRGASGDGGVTTYLVKKLAHCAGG